MNLRAASTYAREVRDALPPNVFHPVPSRLAWLTLHVALAAAGIYAVGHGIGGWWAAPAWSLLIGHSFAGAAFVGHETLHGCVVRHRGLRYAVGWICFLPFTMSPRLWVAWHNKTHHGNTMDVVHDPDAYPTLEAYHASRVTRVADYFSFGASRPQGLMTLALGFTGQSAQMLLRWAGRPGTMSKPERRLAIFETLLGLGVWATVGWFVGPTHFIFAYLIPLLLANAVVIGYILTNHSLSPLTDVNDPLVNSLTVTVPSFIQRVHLNFGLHVEHHLFPSMSSAYAPLVRAELQRRWPERYQSLPLATALGRLFRTPRVYATQTRLHDPRTGLEASTLVPRTTSSPVAESAPSDAGQRAARLVGDVSFCE
ncbi:MAG: fatty acid desaturase [Myxococcales bacterium]|nr:fatty acid desaturase [Myxococcales bacterium]